MNGPAPSGRRRRADTPERAHQVAARLFADKGYDATTTREISEALEITNGTFYHHFASKQQLLSSICLGALEDLIDAVRAELGSASEPVEAVERLVRTHLEVVGAAREAHVTMLVELRALEGERRAAVVAARDQYERLVEEVICAAVDAGALRSSVPPRRLALYLLSMINWTIFWFRPDGDLSPLELADEMCHVFLRGTVHAGPVRPTAESEG